MGAKKKTANGPARKSELSTEDLRDASNFLDAYANHLSPSIFVPEVRSVISQVQRLQAQINIVLEERRLRGTL